MELAFIGMLLSGDLLENKSRFLLFYFTAFMGYTFAITGKTRISIKHVLIFALVFRVTMLISNPSLTIDIYRYYWDGKLVANGINPFLYPPAAENLQPLRDAIYEKLVYKQVHTIYPPFTQLVFAASYLLYPALFTFKFASMLFDVASIIVLLKILQKKGIRERIILYAWNPLIIVEFSSSGHADSVAVFFVLLAYYLLMQNKPLASGVTLALGVSSKLYPILLIPFFIHRNPRTLAGFIPALIVVYLPFASAGWKIFYGLEVFLKYAMFNPGAFQILEYLLGFASAKTVSLLLVVVAYPMLLRSSSLVKACYLILTVYILFSPMVHPWYLAWGLSLAPIIGAYAWIVFSALVGLSYLFIEKTSTGIIWRPDVIIALVQYLPFYGIILWEEIVRRKA